MSDISEPHEFFHGRVATEDRVGLLSYPGSVRRWEDHGVPEHAGEDEGFALFAVLYVAQHVGD